MGLLSRSFGVATLSTISTRPPARRWRVRSLATGVAAAEGGFPRKTGLSGFPSSSPSRHLSFRVCQAVSREGEMDAEPRVVKLKAIEATPESFREFGQVIGASPDGEEFGPQDAHLELNQGVLELNQGVPRFYIMHLEGRALQFSTITHHASVTQCLGSIGGEDWYLGVAKASIVDKDEVNDKVKMEDVQKSKCGHYYLPPIPDDVRVFRISGPKFVKLNKGTWHAGPLFRKREMDFYNLELSNTNVVDHTTHSFGKCNGIKFLVED